MIFSVLTIFYLTEMPGFQLPLLLVISFFHFIYYLKYQPLPSKVDLFNLYLPLPYIYAMYSMTDINGSTDIKLAGSWVCMGAISLACVVNMLYLITNLSVKGY